ncbi:MAG: hypothetical protein ACREJO_02385 [Phycisphaerales bacterium]
MSAKWVRSKQWEREHLTGVWAPVRWVLHAFSTIWLAVILLSLLATFGILASVPVGIMALAPTWIVYALTAAAAVALGAALPAWLVVGRMRRAGVAPAARFAVGLALVIGLTLMSAWLWQQYAWPRLRYSRTTGEGLMLFASFVDRYKDVTVRRLPGMEMSELEFYAWWPLKWVLLAFVVNMVVATVRRIEFVFVNLGVLTVHTGIVTIALGSVFYSTSKVEGDTILLAGEVDPTTGVPQPGGGAPVQGFFDNIRTVMRLRQTPSRDPSGAFEQRALVGLPRYNDYNLAVLGQRTGSTGGASESDDGRMLDLPVPAPFRPDGQNLIDPDIHVRVVGYASYADMRPTWRKVPVPADPTAATPARFIELLSSVPPPGEQPGKPAAAGDEQRVIRVLPFFPTIPAGRWRNLSGAMAIETTRNMPEGRWQELTANLPATALHALVVEIPGQNVSRLYPVQPGQVLEVGEPKWKLEVKELLPQPPFPIITKGYDGAVSSVAIVRVTPPAGSGGAYERYVYSRYSELNQDLLDEKQPNGMPKRRGADGAIKLGYIDASILQVNIDEQATDGKSSIRAIVRIPGQAPRIITGLADDGVIPVAPMVSLRLGERWANAEQIIVPVSVPDADRTERDAIGTHRKAAIAVEVSRVKPGGGAPEWKTVVWAPFTQYFDFTGESSIPVRLPDGRVLEVAFGRLYIPFQDRMAVQLKDFEMIPYPHSTQARDYRSDLVVYRLHQGQFEPSTHMTSLNEPLKISPFIWDSQRGWFTNFGGWAMSKLGASQYKFSQAGWDSRGWNKSRAEAEAGKLSRPFATFTILGVGNNPGIHIIAAGAVMMGAGIPWAFYVKPWLLRRRAERMKRELAAAGKIPVPGAPAANNGGVGAGREARPAGAGT